MTEKSNCGFQERMHRPTARGSRALAILLSGVLVAGLVPAQTGAPARTAPATAAPVPAEAPLTLRAAAQQAVLNNPEVLARWHTVRAAEGERDAAKGGLFPRVDLNAATGPERRNNVNGGYGRSSASLTLSQLLYDGFATATEVRRLDHATRVRIFELIGTSEATALEAARAYYDVLRYRELVRLAEENFVEHRAVYSQTDQRVKARVARAVDLEQITGRLALAEANLLIETSNLHDTTARFQRIVGRLPSREMPVPEPLVRDLPPDASTAIVRTIEGNAFVLAAIENVRAANAALETRSSAYQPRFDVRLRRDQGRNIEGVPGGTNATVAELVMNWNLFNGFSDRARERQFAEQVNVARDSRDKTCRDTRQTTAIAYNDVVKLGEQAGYLGVHESALAKALVAYRQQFQIGQRTLLDLLDTENELFQARRAVVNARYDLLLAYARIHAGVGDLLRAMGLVTLDPAMEAELRNWSAGSEGVQQCLIEPVTLYAVDKPALVQRALSNAVRTPPPPFLRPIDETPGTPGSRTAPPVAAASEEAAVRSAVESWRAAWASRNAEAYLQAYGPDFVPPGGLSRQAWEQRRRSIIGRATDIALELTEARPVMGGADKATVTFIQTYRSASYQDRVSKTMEWRKVDGRWLIVSETSDPAPAR